jgi:hypothetical protein
VKRRVELPDEASKKILMSLAMAKKTDALECLITSGAVVRHASYIWYMYKKYTHIYIYMYVLVHIYIYISIYICIYIHM